MGTLYGLAAALIVCALWHPDGNAAGPPPAVPRLVIEASEADAADAARLRRLDTTELRAAMRLVGLRHPGDHILVLLASEASELARRTPRWVAGFADTAGSTVVLFPGRSLQYPHDSLEQVLQHEVAHILIARAAGGEPVPRWLSEGLATLAERRWGREDERQLALALLARGPVSMEQVDGWFRQGDGHARRAYAVSAAFVRDLLETYGDDAAARILASVAAGESFDAAFVAVTGVPLRAHERTFDARRTSWERWVPLVTGPQALWIAVTSLALLAIWRGRRLRAERRLRWDDETWPDDHETDRHEPEDRTPRGVG